VPKTTKAILIIVVVAIVAKLGSTYLPFLLPLIKQISKLLLQNSNHKVKYLSNIICIACLLFRKSYGKKHFLLKFEK